MADWVVAALTVWVAVAVVSLKWNMIVKLWHKYGNMVLNSAGLCLNIVSLFLIYCSILFPGKVKNAAAALGLVGICAGSILCLKARGRGNG